MEKQREDIYFSYTKKGFLYQFNAIYDFCLDDWCITFLVFHCKSDKIYLGEYNRFRKQILRRLESVQDILEKGKIIAALNDKYKKVISAYLYQYVKRIHTNRPADISLFDYGQSMITKFHSIISSFKIDDLTITQLDQKASISYYFVWDKTIIGSYILYKNIDQDNYTSEF